MEKKLRQLFEYQKFQKNPRLEAMLSEAEARYEGSLYDDDLELVSAAGIDYLMSHEYISDPLESKRAASDQTAIPEINLPPEERL